MQKLTVELEKIGDRDVLAKIAASHELYARAGAGAHTLGSVGRLLRGVVRGDFKIVKVERDGNSDKAVR